MPCFSPFAAPSDQYQITPSGVTGLLYSKKKANATLLFHLRMNYKPGFWVKETLGALRPQTPDQRSSTSGHQQAKKLEWNNQTTSACRVGDTKV
jgi:hypothetical protein